MEQSRVDQRNKRLEQEKVPSICVQEKVPDKQ